jgi:hypothetical protein
MVGRAARAGFGLDRVVVSIDPLHRYNRSIEPL